MKVACGMRIEKEEEYDGDVLHIISHCDGYSRRKKQLHIGVSDGTHLRKGFQVPSLKGLCTLTNRIYIC